MYVSVYFFVAKIMVLRHNFNVGLPSVKLFWKQFNINTHQQLSIQSSFKSEKATDIFHSYYCVMISQGECAKWSIINQTITFQCKSREQRELYNQYNHCHCKMLCEHVQERLVVKSVYQRWNKQLWVSEWLDCRGCRCFTTEYMYARWLCLLNSTTIQQLT